MKMNPAPVKIFAARNPKRTANIVFGILDMLTILLYLRLFRILPTSIFLPYEIPLVPRFLFTLEFLLLVSFGVSGILYFLDKPAAYFMYPPQFVGRLTFALFSFGFLFKIRIIFNAQGVYSVVFGVCVVLEIFRLVGTIFMFRQMYRNRETYLSESAK